MMQHIKINGRRGAFLLLWALIYALMAAAYFLTGRFPPAIAWLDPFIPGEALGAVWGVPAVFALTGAFRVRPKDAYAFAALSTAPVIWSSLYILGFFVTGEFTAILGTALYVGIAAMVMVVSGMEGATDRADRLDSMGGD